MDRCLLGRLCDLRRSVVELPLEGLRKGAEDALPFLLLRGAGLDGDLDV